jgi:hypothetical protein
VGKCLEMTHTSIMNAVVKTMNFTLESFLKVKLFLCLTYQALSHEDVWGSGCIDSHFIDLGTSWS